MRSITMEEALSIILETFKEAHEQQAHGLGAVVLDAGGHVKAFLRQDGASIMRFEISRGKAWAALAMNRSSRMVLQKAKDKPLFMDTLRDLAPGPIFLEAGAQLIRDDAGEIIACIGVTGDVNEVDDICALAGIRAAGFKTDEDFSPEDVRRLNIKVGPPIVDPRKQA